MLQSFVLQQLNFRVSASKAQLRAVGSEHLSVGEMRESADIALQQGEDGGDVANFRRTKAAQAAEFPHGPAARIRRRMSEGNRRLHAKGSSSLCVSADWWGIRSRERKWSESGRSIDFMACANSAL